MGDVVEKARISENKNVQPDIQIMTYNPSPAALEAMNDVNSSIFIESTNCNVVNTKLGSRSDVSTRRKTLPLESVPL